MYICTQVAETLAQSEGVSKLLVAQHDAFKGYLPGVLFFACTGLH